MGKERGNILFLILLAVVLFAALAYAVTSSMRGGGKDAGREKLKLLATQLIENATMAENAIMRTMLMNGTPEYGLDLSGENSALAPNATCTLPDCRVFQTSGGGVPSFRLPAWASSDTSKSNYYKLRSYMVSVQNVGTEQEEVLYVYPWLKRDVCEAINEVAGAQDINLGISEAFGGSGTVAYNGTLTAVPASGAVFGDQVAGIKGKQTFCFFHSSDPATGLGYVFAHVILAR